MKETDTQGLFWKWGRSIYRFRWFVVSLWLFLFVCLALFAMKTPGMLEDNGFTPHGSDSQLAMEHLQAELDLPGSSLQLVYESEQLDLSSEQQQQLIMQSLEPLKQRADVAGIHFVQASKRQQANGIVAVNVSFDLDPEAALSEYKSIRELVTAPEGMNVYATGGTAIMYDIQEASKKDIVQAELIGLPIALIVLLLIFGTLLSALLPMIVGVMSVTITLGIIYFMTSTFSFSSFTPSIVTMLGLAIGIDYALFMVSRFREELKRQATIEAAVAMTCQRAGKSIFFSGIAVLIGLISMLFIPLDLFYSLSIGGTMVVMLSVILANTLLLALLSLFGQRINALQVIPAAWRGSGERGFWRKTAYVVMKRPLSMVLLLGGLLIFLMLPLFGIKMGIPAAEVLPANYESRHGSDLIQQTYESSELNPIQIAVLTEQEVWDEPSMHQLAEYMEQVAGLPQVKEMYSYLHALGLEQLPQTAFMLQQAEVRQQLTDNKLAKGHTALITVVPEPQLDHDQTDELVRQIRALDSEGVTALVTGEAAYRIDVIERINAGIPYVLLFVMGVTYIILMFAFHSMVLPLKAVLMNVLGLGASLGVVVSVFQHGHFAELMHISSIGTVNATLPVLIFCVVFGISMDYEVFLISRIAEEYEKSGNNEQSTAEGLRKTGGLITGAAAILIVVVGTFIFADIEIMKALGLGLVFAVLIDATVIRLIMVPALMKLLGRLNWWAPKWLHPIQHDKRDVLQ